MDTNETDIEKFLSILKQKIKVFNIVFIERDKTRKTLAELEKTELNCYDYILSLKVENYYKGPTKDSEHGGEYWEFGMTIEKKEVYIKINYGLPNKPVICISFHFAEFQIKYKFR